MTNSPSEYTDSEVTTHDNWREAFLQRILISAAIISIFALIPAVLSTNDLIFQSIYIGAFTILVTVTLVRFPYKVKAIIFASLPFIIGVSSLLENGIYGDVQFWFLAFIGFMSLLISIRSGVVAIILSELVLIVTGYLLLTDQYKLSNTLVLEGTLADWTTVVVALLLISLVVLFGLRMLLEEFNRTRARNEDILSSLLESQTELEKRVTERTRELARKNWQISASNFVAHQIVSIQDLNTLLNETVELVSKRFGYYHTAIYLINPRGDYATLQAASSEGGKKLVNQGFRLRVGVEGIVGFVAAEKRPRIALNVGEDAFYFDSPDLPETRSELALPLVVRDKVIGVLDMQSNEVQAFRYDELEMFQTLSDQIAVAIDNARLLTESQMTISQLEIISSENSRRNWQIELLNKKPAFHYSASGIRPTAGNVSLEGKNVLTVPLILRGQQIGKITLQRKNEFQHWTSQDEIVAREIATQTALALENVRLVERTRLRANKEQEIVKMTARIRETLDLETVLRTSARELQNTLNLEEAEVRLFPQDDPKEKKTA